MTIRMTDEPEDFEGKWPDQIAAPQQGDLMLVVISHNHGWPWVAAPADEKGQDWVAKLRSDGYQIREYEPAEESQRLRDALKPFAAIDLTTNQAVDAMDVLRARRALEGSK